MGSSQMAQQLEASLGFCSFRRSGESYEEEAIFGFEEEGEAMLVACMVVASVGFAEEEEMLVACMVAAVCIFETRLFARVFLTVTFASGVWVPTPIENQIFGESARPLKTI